MTKADRHELLRDLLGELPPARQATLQARLAAEPALARARAELAASWRELELPPPATAPPAFPSRLRARAEQEEKANLFGSGWRPATAAAGMLSAGLALGVWVGAGLGPKLAAPMDTAAAPASSSPSERAEVGDDAADPAPGIVDTAPAMETVAEVDPDSAEDSAQGFAGDTFADAYLALLTEEEIAR